jgi:hypothetical protein
MDDIGDWGGEGSCWSETTIIASAPLPPPNMMPQRSPPMGPPPMPQPQPQPMHEAPMPQMPPMPYYGPMQPPQRSARGMGDAESMQTRHTLGLSLILVPLVGAAGLYYGGPFGGAAGLLFGGAVVNAYRAASNVTKGLPDADREAMVSGTYAVLGVAVGGYLAWRVYEAKHKPATRSPVGG